MAFKRVATEGVTTDGRKISRDWLQQMAANYNPAKYGARIWLEHMRGLFPDGPLPALGDVKALKVEENGEGKLELYADIDPTDVLKDINSRRQKVYSSIEVDPDFAGTGEAYLVGLAVTDSPASLGTEMLQFSAQQGTASPLSGRKQRPENIFTAAAEFDIDFSDAEPTPAGADPNKPSLLDSVKALFKRHDNAHGQHTEALRKDVQESLELLANKQAELATAVEALPGADSVESLKSRLADIESKYAALHKQLDNTADTTQRPPALGGDGNTQQTDC